MKFNPETIFINYQFVNANNEGSLRSNKEYQICYAITDIDIIKSRKKKIIGCFINPNDLYLDKNIDRNIFYFQMYMNINKVFNVYDLLQETIYSKTYSNQITKKILFESKDVTTKKIATKCLETLKERILVDIFDVKQI